MDTFPQRRRRYTNFYVMNLGMSRIDARGYSSTKAKIGRDIVFEIKQIVQLQINTNQTTISLLTQACKYNWEKKPVTEDPEVVVYEDARSRVTDCATTHGGDF